MSEREPSVPAEGWGRGWGCQDHSVRKAGKRLADWIADLGEEAVEETSNAHCQSKPRSGLPSLLLAHGVQWLLSAGFSPESWMVITAMTGAVSTCMRSWP